MAFRIWNAFVAQKPTHPESAATEGPTYTYVEAQLHQEYPSAVSGLNGETLALHGNKESRETDFDIVAVQGLGSHYETTWSVKCPEEAGGRYHWLRQKLPSDFPNARVLAFEYDSRYYEEPSHVSLEECGHQLLRCLVRDRCGPGKIRMSSEHRKKPLILIGHSFGGLVVKQALILAAQFKPSSTDQAADWIYRNHRDLLASITGVFFLGTPHRGTTFTTWGQFQLSWKQFRGIPINRDLITLLEVDSFMLMYLHNQFNDLTCNNDIFKSVKLRVYCYYERYEVPYLRRLVVDQDSACLDDAVHRVTDANHMDMNKFRPGHDNRYNDIRDDLLAITATSDDVVERRHLRWRYGAVGANLDCKNVLRWLNPSGSEIAQDEQQKERLAKQQSASFTCQWLLTNSIFMAWASFETSHNVLWINGKAGTGKSVLSAFIIDALRSRSSPYMTGEGSKYGRPSRPSEMTSRPTVLFFFCGIDRASENPWSFIGSFIHQLISDDHIDEEQKAKLLEMTTEAQKAYTASAAGSFRDWRYLSDLLQKLVNVVGRLHIVIDGLEECQNSVDCLRTLKIFNDQPNVRLLVLSQHTADVQKTIHTTFDFPAHFSITDYTAGDISGFANLKVRELVSRKPEFSDGVDEITTKLRTSADGIFEWINESVIYLESDHIEVDGLSQTLVDLPVGLPSMYEKVLAQTLSKHEEVRFRVTAALRWLAVSARPMTAMELKNALAIEVALKVQERETPQEFGFGKELLKLGPANEHAANDIHKLLGTLVQISSLQQGEYYVQLVHPSLKVFLLSDLTDPPTLSQFHFSAAEAHGHCANVCMAVCSETTLTHAQARNRQLPPLVDYAWSYWSYHRHLSRDDLEKPQQKRRLNTMVENVSRDGIVFLNILVGFASSPVVRLPDDDNELRATISLQHAQDSLLPAVQALEKVRTGAPMLAQNMQRPLKDTERILLLQPDALPFDEPASGRFAFLTKLKARFTPSTSDTMSLQVTKAFQERSLLVQHAASDSMALWDMSKALRLVALRFSVNPIAAALAMEAENSSFSPIHVLSRIANLAEECGNLPYWDRRVLPTPNLDFTSCFVCPPGDRFFGPAKFVLGALDDESVKVAWTQDRVKIHETKRTQDWALIGNEHRQHVREIHQLPGDSYIVADLTYNIFLGQEKYHHGERQVTLGSIAKQLHMQTKLHVGGPENLLDSASGTLARHAPQDFRENEYEHYVKAVPQLLCVMYVQYIMILLQVFGQLTRQAIAQHAARLELAFRELAQAVLYVTAIFNPDAALSVRHVPLGLLIFWLRCRYIPWWAAFNCPHTWRELYLGLRHPAVFLNVDIAVGWRQWLWSWFRMMCSEMVNQTIIQFATAGAQQNEVSQVACSYVVFTVFCQVQRSALSVAYALVTVVATGIVMFADEETAGGVVKFTIAYWAFHIFNMVFVGVRAGLTSGANPVVYVGAIFLQLFVIIALIIKADRILTLVSWAFAPITVPLFLALKAISAALHFNWLPVIRIVGGTSFLLGTAVAVWWAHRWFVDPHNTKASLLALYQASQLARPALGRHDVKTVYQIANDDLLHSKAPSRQPSPRPSPRRSPNLNPLHGSDVTGLSIGTPASILASQLSIPEDLGAHVNLNMAGQGKSKTSNQERLNVPTQGDGESGGPQFGFNTGAGPDLKVHRLGGNKSSGSERITHPTQSTPSLPNQANSVSTDELSPEELFNRFFGGGTRFGFGVGEPQEHLKTE